MKIAIQGYPGAFHEIAARLYFDGQSIEVVPMESFQQLVASVDSNEDVDAGVIAIENSIAGGLLYNHDLVNKSSVQIVGEIYLRIQHHLMAMPNVPIESIQEVHSHHMAIAQCSAFFKQYPSIKLVESRDTASAARWIQDNNAVHVGAIGSKRAAELYGLNILSESIESNKRNYTRFIVIDHFMDAPSDDSFNKVSISFAVSHETGSLYKALKVVSENGANMTKIQSAPIPGRPFEYLFYVDFMLADTSNFGTVLQNLSLRTKGLKILGKYKAGAHHEG